MVSSSPSRLCSYSSLVRMQITGTGELRSSSVSLSPTRCVRANGEAMAVIQNACIFGFAGLTQPSQWQAANALYVTGNIGRCERLRRLCQSVVDAFSSKSASGVLPRCLSRYGAGSAQDDRVRAASPSRRKEVIQSPMTRNWR
jgi:hypothetical protein